jgi:hypothetical protein
VQKTRNEEEGSAHCSSIGGGAGRDEIIEFFRNDMLNVQEWHFDKDEGQENTALSRKFEHYADAIANELGVTVINVENSNFATERIAIVDPSNRHSRLSGHSDFFFASRAPNFRILCVIECQGNRDEVRCELQILSYILLLMNKCGLPRLFGILVLDDGRCRSYRAYRNNQGGMINEENDRLIFPSLCLC